MSSTVHYSARFAAEGGPDFTGPRIDPAAMISDETAAVTVLYLNHQWVIADHQGNVYASADNPAELVRWMSVYLSTLGHEIDAQRV